MTVDVRVLTVTPEGSTLEWQPGATAANVPTAQELASDPLAGMKPIIKLTRDGEVAGLVNEVEVLAKLQAAVDIVRRGLAEKLPPNANREGMEAMLAQVLSPTILIGSVLRDARTYFGLNGVELAMGATVTVDMKQPNPIGGEPIPTKFSVRIESATADTAVFATTTAFDAATLTRMSLQMMEKAGERFSPAELAKFEAMQIGEEGRFVFDRAVGLMREGTVNRTLRVAGQTRLDRTEIRLVTAPRR